MAHRRAHSFLAAVGAGVLLFAVASAEAPPVHAQGVEDELRPDSPSVVHYTGRVKLALTSMLISPGKSSGLPWDGPGSLPPGVAAKLQSGAGKKLTNQLFRALSLGIPPIALLAELEAWTIGAFIGGNAPPDIEARVYVDEQLVAFAPKVQNSYVPSWGGAVSAVTKPLTLKPHSQIVISVMDRDLLADDSVGTCTLQGMPYVDDHGYAISSSFRCGPQIWAVGLRVIPDDSQPDDAPAADGPNNSAALPAPQESVGNKTVDSSSDFDSRKATLESLKKLANALTVWKYTHSDTCPVSPRELVDGKILESIPRDGWGGRLAVRCHSNRGHGVDVISAGPDGVMGTPDDMSNWDTE